MSPPVLTAIILAAGKGKRIGQTKWSLVSNGKTFLTTVIEKIIAVGIREVICVVRADSIPVDFRIDFVINPMPELGMFSSIYCGVQKNSSSLGYLIYPIDHPFVAVATLNNLCQSFIDNFSKVVCPVFEQKLGHPIIIPNHLAKKITFSDYEGGLRKFLLDQQSELYKVKVNDKNILRNINNKLDYGKAASTA